MFLYVNIIFVIQSFHLLDGINHLQAHIDTIRSMLWSRDWQARYTIITIAQDFNAQTVIFL